MNQLPENDLPPGRHRLLKEHLMTEIRREDEAPARTGGKWLRPAIAAAAVAVVAATAIVALPGGESSPATSEEAVALLENVALAAEHEKVPDDIRDDEFVYIQSKVSYMTYEEGKAPTRAPVHKREIWLSVDGTLPGLLEEDRDHDSHLVLEPSKPGIPSNTNYRNLQTLPTDPDKMLDWLHKQSDGGKSEDQNTFVLVGDLSYESLLPPDVGAALYRAAAEIPGVTVVQDAVDADGRHGIAVAREDDGIRQELIFDPKTYEFLGERQVAVQDTYGLKKGQVVGVSAILDRTVVDKAGQRP
ncbi:CU044_5270 family protein [Streptomyces sp. NBC_00828]|uniref:CU044_5270 family protein n=1 Tax=Streptomyces sp. NBC_00828 TaxID=2903678 RepID=UPI0038678162